MSLLRYLRFMKIVKISGGMHVKIDDEDFELVTRRKWKAHKSSTNFYARHNIRVDGKYKNVLMHRMIMKAPIHLQVHHINGDTLDNQKLNLQFCTNKENHASTRRIKPHSSKYRGVSKFGEKWVARMMVDYKNKHLGLFETEKEAALVRDRFAFKKYGKIAYLNFPLEIEAL